MAQVILIESNETMNDLLSINFTSYLGVDLIHRKNASETINLLNILPSIDLIICCAKVGSEDTANDIHNYILQNKLEINLIVLGGSLSKKTTNTIEVVDGHDWERVIQNSAKILGINEEVLSKKIVPDYVAVPVKYFLNLDTVNCDVFIRIKKSATEFQFVKRIHNGDSFTKDAIVRYQDQGLEFFHIPKEHHKNFAIFLSNRLVERIDQPNMNEGQKIQLMGESYDIATKEILSLGFNSETIQLTDSIISNMIRNFEKSPEMSNLLHKVINSKTGILYQRCHMTSVVATEMIKNLKINEHNTIEKVAFASFFHDIILTDKPELSKINSFEELEKSQLSESDWDLVFNHAHEASLLIKTYPDAPLGADEIIRHHHGAFNGKGFSNAIDRLPDLSKIFIIAHHFVLELLKFKENGGEPKPLTEELSKRYPSPEILIIIKSLEKTLKKKK
jgi:HD-GYP domain-containing protein (c-di-GMP phosphodiesterase class II)